MANLKSNFIICTRDVDRRGRFVAEPGDTRFLRIPKGLKTYGPSHEIKSRERWRLAVRADAAEVADRMVSDAIRLLVEAQQHDKVLGVSNAKRLGTAPRVGRVGLPEQAHRKAVNVDCSNYFCTKDPASSSFNGTFNHSWHIGDELFALDLALTMEGAIDRHALPTREPGDNDLAPRLGARPMFQPAWDAATPGEARAVIAG